MGSRRGVFSFWLGWSWNRGTSYPDPWIRSGWSSHYRRSCGVALWLLCACAGAVFAAFALREQRASAARRGLSSFIAAVLMWTVIMAASAAARHGSIGIPLPKLVPLFKQFLPTLPWPSPWRRWPFEVVSFTPLSGSKQWREEWFGLVFGDFCLRSMGHLTYPHFPFPAHRHSQQRSQL